MSLLALKTTRFSGLYAIKQRINVANRMVDKPVALNYADLKSDNYTPFSAACHNTLKRVGLPSSVHDLISNPDGHLFYVANDQNGPDFSRYFPLFDKPTPQTIAAFWQSHRVHGTLQIRANQTGQTLDFEAHS